jgi:S-DNA-T family DNA segregation ATPase FtsK/SpoIIIE
MDAHTIGVLLVGGAALAVLVWVFHKIGKALIAMFEALATIAVVFLAVWAAVKMLVWLARQVVTHRRTSITALAVALWWQYWGWPSLALTLTVMTTALVVWRCVDLVSFDAWVGRWLRAWWQRWTIYAPKLPGWLHACGLSVTDITTPTVVSLNVLGRPRLRRAHHGAGARIPKVVGVRSGPSWDQVRVRLVPGQKPEDFDEAARALASARAVTRCQVRELTPTWCRSISNAVTCSPIRWTAPTWSSWPRFQGRRWICGASGPGVTSMARTGRYP